MIGFVRIAEIAAQAFARTEARHWVGVGASVALHLGVLLGWHNAPPPEPQPISFEVTFEPPEADAQKAVKPKVSKKLAAKQKASKKAARQRKTKTQVAKDKVKPDIVRREPHLLDADWRAEKKPAKDAPELALPDAQALGVQAAQQESATPHGAQSLQRSVVGAAMAQVSEAAKAGDSGAGLSEPAAASAGSAPGKPAETGLVMTNSTTPAASQGVRSDASGGGAQTSNSPASLAGASAGGESQGGLPGFARTSTPQAALSAASGAGMQAAVTPDATSRIAQGGAEASGVRLMASGILSSAVQVPAGEGATFASPQAAQAQGSGQSVAARPASNSVSGGSLSGSAQGRSGGQNPAAGYSGSAAVHLVDAAASHGGRGQEGVARFAATLPAAQAASGVQSTGLPGRSGQRSATVGLAPGEPGSSPNFAVTLQPILAATPGGIASRGAGNTAGASRDVAASSGRAAPGTGLHAGEKLKLGPIYTASGRPASYAAGQAPGLYARAGVADGGAAPRQGAAAAVLNAARESGRPPVVLQATRPVAVNVVRPDTEIQRLDVLAPSNYCPLPLPGHQQPDNRAPQPDRQIAEQPAYALDNPSIQYPVMANIHRVEGRVTVRVEVLADGKPGKMWLKQSSGSGILDRDAQTQLKQWRFVPARINGQTVSAWIDVPVMYRLAQDKP